MLLLGLAFGSVHRDEGVVRVVVNATNAFVLMVMCELSTCNKQQREETRSMKAHFLHGKEKLPR